MNVSLPQELEDLVKEKVATGRYGSASEVIRAGIRMLDAHDQKLEALRQDTQHGLDDLESGNSAELDIDALKSKARKIRKSKNSPRAK